MPEEVVKVYDFSHTYWVDFVRMSLEPVHKGHFNQTWAPWLYGIVGLMLTGLGITGFIIWYIKNIQSNCRNKMQNNPVAELTCLTLLP
jgi:uncharacterized iron-regulated membrane protein